MHPSLAGWTGGGGGRQWKRIRQYSSASGGTQTHDPWIKRTKTCTTWPPDRTYIHTSSPHLVKYCLSLT